MTKKPPITRDVAVMERALIITTTALMRIILLDATDLTRGMTPSAIAGQAFHDLTALKHGGFG